MPELALLWASDSFFLGVLKLHGTGPWVVGDAVEAASSSVSESISILYLMGCLLWGAGSSGGGEEEGDSERIMGWKRVPSSEMGERDGRVREGDEEKTSGQ